MKKHMIAVLAVLAVTVGCSGRRVYGITYNDSDEALIQGPTEADAGENVSFTLRNEPGEFFVDVTIDGCACRPVRETKEDMTFEFVMPEYDVVIDIERSSRPWLSMDQVTSDTQARQEELLAAFYLEDLRPAEGATFLEITLYDFDDEHMRMEVIRSGNTAEEETAAYQVPVQIYDRLLEMVRQYDMASWDKTGTEIIPALLSLAAGFAVSLKFQ